LRTILLICLAAAISMIQANLLLPTVGKTPDSFVVLDLMRLPLGILTGVGFIGAGAILRRDDLIVGVTTAATIWFVTVMGLCFGGGQLGLGLAALALSLLVLGGLKHLEEHWHHDRHGTLIVTVGTTGPGETEIARIVRLADCKIVSWSVNYLNDVSLSEYHCTLRWRGFSMEALPPVFLKELAQLRGVARLSWKPF
jgi:putative Mg2+ transporter-C (MgtC) family protein